MDGKLSIPLSKVYMDDDIKNAVLEVLDSGWYILGEKVRQFEERFADYCGVKYAVCTSSGTSAIFLSLLSIGIGPKDEVIVPSFSFIATVSPILHLGAKPVFADIDLRTYNLNPNAVEKKVTKRTKAIIPVHLYGHPADMDPLIEVAEKNGLHILEDACQAHGAEYKGKKAGGIGHIACFSFYPSKNMTVCGDGGIITTDCEETSEKIQMLRNHGRTEKYVHDLLGYNLRFNEIQAAIGLKQLEKLPNWIEARRKIAKMYSNALKSKVTTPIEESWAKHVYHMYVIRTQKRDNLKKYLEYHKISAGVHYPLPIHRQPAVLSYIKSRGALKNTDECARSVLSLPIYPTQSKREVRYVYEKVIDFLETNTG